MKTTMTKLLTCLCLALLANPASAITTADFLATVVDSGSLFNGNSYDGTLSYDETALGGTGDEILGVDLGAVLVSFDFEGQLFNETHDSEFDIGFPELGFSDGELISIDYLLIQGLSGVDFNDPIVDIVRLQGDLILGGGGAFSVDANVEVVPVPAALPLLVSAIAGLGLFSRRRVNA